MIGIFCAISICCAASRATWSFARDHAIPCSRFFTRINHGFLEGVPLNAYLLATLIQILLGLIFLGSSAAFNAFVGVGVICLGASYAMPVLLSILNGRREMRDAPYNLGRWGYLVNWIAVLWVLFEIVLFSMPAVIPVTPTTMSGYPPSPTSPPVTFVLRILWLKMVTLIDYASVVFVGFAVISAIWYIISE